MTVIIGIGVLVVAWMPWRRCPAGDSSTLPVWLSRVDAMVAPAALGLAFILIAANPKNVLVAGAAGAVIGRSDLLALWAPRTALQLLARLRRWLTKHNAVITAVVLGALGIAVSISGISLL